MWTLYIISYYAEVIISKYNQWCEIIPISEKHILSISIRPISNGNFFSMKKLVIYFRWNCFNGYMRKYLLIWKRFFFGKIIQSLGLRNRKISWRKMKSLSPEHTDISPQHAKEFANKRGKRSYISAWRYPYLDGKDWRRELKNLYTFYHDIPRFQIYLFVISGKLICSFPIHMNCTIRWRNLRCLW